MHCYRFDVIFGIKKISFLSSTKRQLIEQQKLAFSQINS